MKQETYNMICAAVAAVLIVCLICAAGARAVDMAAAAEAERASAVPSEISGVGREIFRLTEEGKRMLARLVYLESGGNSDELRRCVAEVVLNRLASGWWGPTLTDVMFAPQQFPPVSRLWTVPDGEGGTPDDEAYARCLEIVREVCREGCRIPARVMYYIEDGYPAWAVDEFELEGAYFSSSPWLQPEGYNA